MKSSRIALAAVAATGASLIPAADALAGSWEGYASPACHLYAFTSYNGMISSTWAGTNNGNGAAPTCRQYKARAGNGSSWSTWTVVSSGQADAFISNGTPSNGRGQHIGCVVKYCSSTILTYY